MKLVGVRHGQTTDNSKHIVAGGGVQGKLDSTGLRQVRAVGLLFKKEKFDFIYCSDLKRCKDTLKAIAKYHQHIPVVFTPQIRERNFGVFEGRHRDEWLAVLEKNKYSSKFRPKNGESFDDVKKRVHGFLKYLKKNHPNDTILMVTHGAFLRMLYSIVIKVPIQKIYQKHKFHNTAVFEYEFTGKKIKIHRFNEIKHL